MVMPEEYERRHYIKPEEAEIWMRRGYRIYRGTRGGLYVILGREREGAEEEGKGREQSIRFTALSEEEEKLVGDLKEKMEMNWKVVFNWVLNQSNKLWGEGEDHKRRQDLLSGIYYDVDIDPSETLHLLYLLLKDVEGDKELEGRVHEIANSIGIDLTDKAVLEALRKGVVHVPKELIEFVENVEKDLGIDGLSEYLRKYKVREEYYVTVNMLKGLVESLLSKGWEQVVVNILTDKGLKGVEYYKFLYRLAQSLGIKGIEKFLRILESLNMIAGVRKADPENLRYDVLDDIIPKILAEVEGSPEAQKIVIGKKIQSIDNLSAEFMSKVLGEKYWIENTGAGLVSHFNYLKLHGFNNDEALALAKGFQLMRHWTMKNFKYYAGCIEEFVQKLVGNGRAKRPCEKRVGDEFEAFEKLLDTMTEHEFTYYREFMKRLLKRFHEGKKVVLYRGLNEIESFFAISSAILAKPVELIGTVNSFSYDVKVAWSFTNYAVVKVEVDTDKNAVGGWFVASPRYLHEEELILEITKDIKVVNFTLIDHLEDALMRFWHSNKFSDWVDAFYELVRPLRYTFDDAVRKFDVKKVASVVEELDEYFADYIEGMKLERVYDEDTVDMLREIYDELKAMKMKRAMKSVKRLLEEAGEKGF